MTLHKKKIQLQERESERQGLKMEDEVALWSKTASILVKKKHVWKNRVKQVVALLAQEDYVYCWTEPASEPEPLIVAHPKEKNAETLANTLLIQMRASDCSPLKKLFRTRRSNKNDGNRWTNMLSFFYFVSCFGPHKRMTLAQFDTFLSECKAKVLYHFKYFVTGLLLLKKGNSNKLSRVGDVFTQVKTVLEAYEIPCQLGNAICKLMEKNRKQERLEARKENALAEKTRKAKEVLNKLPEVYERLNLTPSAFTQYAREILDNTGNTSKNHIELNDTAINVLRPILTNEEKVFQSMLSAKATHTLLFQSAARLGQITEVSFSNYTFQVSSSAQLTLELVYKDKKGGRKGVAKDAWYCVRANSNPDICPVLSMAQLVVFALAQRNSNSIEQTSMENLHEYLQTFKPLLASFMHLKGVSQQSNGTKLLRAMHSLLMAGCGVDNPKGLQVNLHIYRTVGSEVLVANGLQGSEVDTFVGWSSPSNSTRTKNYQESRSEIVHSPAVRVLAELDINGGNDGDNSASSRALPVSPVHGLLCSMPDKVKQDAVRRLLACTQHDDSKDDDDDTYDSWARGKATGVFHSLYHCALLCYIALAMKPDGWLAQHYFKLHSSEVFVWYSKEVVRKRLALSKSGSRGERRRMPRRKFDESLLENEDLRKRKCFISE